MLFKKNNPISQKQLDLIKCISDTRRELKVANRNFEIAEEELIDYYSYQIKANKAKLDYLIKKVKQKGIVLDTINALQLGLYYDKAI
ncbi:MAG: YaaL family protein [Oscillospiraceae bacterium]|nr:YaaL family protein [Oscillospiraceae bacterium]